MRALIGATAALALGAADAVGFAPSSTPTGDWMAVGGRVNAVARAGDAIYLGGRFQGLARHAPGAAAFDPDSGDLVAPTARLDPLVGRTGTTPVSVTAITDAPDGGVYVAGTFAGAGGVAQPRLLRFAPSGALDVAFRPRLGVGPGTQITDMGVGADGVLYLAGLFTTVGDPTVGDSRRAGGLAAVDAASGAPTPWQPAVPQLSVKQLEAGPAAVYLGGSFTRVGGTDRTYAAAVAPGDGTLLSWNPAPDGPVNALALRGSSVYVGGVFTKVGVTARPRLAAVQAAGAGALRTDWTPPVPDGAVNRIAVDESRVFVAGSFNTLGDQRRTSLAAVNATTGELLAWDPQASREPSDVALRGERVYLSWKGGGPLPKLGSAVRCGLASVSAAGTGGPLDWDPGVDGGDSSGLACNPDNGGYVSGTAALTVAGGTVWAGGTFTVANIRPRTGLAALDALTGQPLDWAPRLAGGRTFGNDIVHDLAPSADGSTIYVGGRFAKINEQSRANAAALTAGGTGTLTNWNPAPSGDVRTLALSPDGGLVYLGGDFRRLGDRDLPRLAAVRSDTTAQQTVVESWRPNPDRPVLDLLTDAAGGRLYVAGRFGTIAGSARPGLAALDAGATPQAPPVTPWSPALTGTPSAEIEALALRGSLELVAGGTFSTPDGGHNNLAAIRIADAALAPWAPVVNGRVQTVAIDPADGTSYVTGRFSTVGDDQRRAGAAAFGADGAATGWDPAPGNNYPGTEYQELPAGGVVALGDRLLLTGQFIELGGRLQAGFAFFGPAQAPSPAGPPMVTGSPQVGQQLTCVPGSWAGGRGTLTVAWLRDGSPDEPIVGATSAKYTITSADGGRALRCRETMTNAAAAVRQDSAAVTVEPLPPALDTPPAVAGQAWVGGTAECTTGLWHNAPTKYAYRWFLDDGVEPIAGATSATLELTAAELGHRLACEVTASNDARPTPAAARSAAVTITEAPPAASSGPRIAGEARVGSRLTCEPGPWERARGFAYQWLRDRVPLVDAVAPTYAATSRDLGKALSCLVSAHNAGGTTSAESAAVVVLASARSAGTGRRANRSDDDGTAGSAAAARARRIDIRGVQLRSRGRLTVTVSAPGAGRVRVAVMRSSGAKATAAKKKTKTKTLASGLRSVARAGRATLQLKLSSSARRLVARAGKVGLRVTVRATFRPANGSAVSNDRTTATLSTRGLRR